MKKVVGFMVLAAMVASFAFVSCKAGEDGDTVYIPYTPETKDSEKENKAAEMAQVPVITSQPQGATYTVGTSDVNPLRVIAEVTDGGKLEYQWYQDDVEISGATNKSFTPDVSATGKHDYNCRVTNTLGSSVREKFSDYAKIIVQAGVTTTVAAIPEITAKSPDRTYTSEDNTDPISVTAIVTATENKLSGTLYYQWFIDGREIPDATNYIYEIGKAENVESQKTHKYYCEVTNKANDATDKNHVSETVKSGEICITIIPKGYNLSSAATPEISGEPQSAIYSVDENTRPDVTPLSVSATVTDNGLQKAGTLSYQWYKKDGSIIQGATSETYQPFENGKAPVVETETTYSYYCVVTNTYEAATDPENKVQTKKSADATITIKPLPKPVSPIFSEGKNLPESANGESKVTLSVEATVNDGGTISYQWYKDGTPISGATNSSYEANKSGTYYVEVTNSLRGFSTRIKSNECTVTIGGGSNTGDAGIDIDFN